MKETTRNGIVRIDEIGAAGQDLVGVKGKALGDLVEGSFDVPPGFVVTANVYSAAVESAGIADRLARLWVDAEGGSVAKIKRIARTSERLIRAVSLDVSVRRRISEEYERLGPEVSVAVRSSSIPNGVSGPGSAGIHTTFTSVVGVDNVVDRIHGCWASLYGERALTMHSRGLAAAAPSMAVVVQRMIAAERSGLLTPLHGDQFLVGATFGLGEPIVSGSVSPDQYVFDYRASIERSITIGPKRVALMATEDSDRHVLLPVTERRERVLSTDRLRALGDISAAVDRHLGCPHEIEWCTVGDSFYILQARPIRGPASPDVDDAKVLLVGTGVGRGVATGTVRIAIDIDAASHTIAGDILVAPETAPEWLPFIGRASAVVADLGDEHGHTATACRELGIPAIVGTATATTMLNEFRCVTVDADHGHVLPAASD